MQQISLREANQHLSRYIQTVEKGEDIIITRRGKPIARLTAITVEKQLTDEQQAARERTRKRMRQGYALGGQGLERDALYER